MIVGIREHKQLFSGIYEFMYDEIIKDFALILRETYYKFEVKNINLFLSPIHLFSQESV